MRAELLKTRGSFGVKRHADVLAEAMKVTLDLPDEYSAHLPTTNTKVAEVRAAGLRCRRGRRTHVSGVGFTLASDGVLC